MYIHSLNLCIWMNICKLLYTYIQIVALAVNESGRYEDSSGGCTFIRKCRWTDIRGCYDDDDSCGVLADVCNNVDYSDNLYKGTKAGNGAALAFNIIGLLLLTVAIIVIFIKSIQDKIGKYIRIMVGLSALCSLIAIIAMAAGNAGENECWDNPFPDNDAISVGPGITFYVQIAVFVLLIIATILIHIGYGAGGSGGSTN